MNSIVPFPHQAPPPDEWVAEEKVLALRPMLSRAGLRKARVGGTLRWYVGKRGSAWYTLADVDNYIRGEKCRNKDQAQSLNSGDNGSPASPEGPTGTDIGLSPELESQTAEALARMI